MVEIDAIFTPQDQSPDKEILDKGFSVNICSFVFVRAQSKTRSILTSRCSYLSVRK